MDCNVCGADNLANARFCARCGAELSPHCRHCDGDLPAGARFCPACGWPAEAVSRPAPAERRLVTVLFADFEGFTAFADKRDAEDVHDYIGSLWDQLTPIIEAHEGSLEKYVGDAIMALFGVKQAREDDPANAVRAALAIQARLRELQTDSGQRPLPMRIAINTGLIVIQPIGSSGEFRAVGDPLNLASRLQKHAPPGSVLISQDTFRHVHGLFELQRCAPLQVAGKAEAVQTYVVLQARPRAVARPMRGVEGAEIEMVDREVELKRLRSIFHTVLERRELHLVTIVGEAGMGKSRLMQEFLKWIELLPVSVRLFWGRATAEMPGSPFALMRDLLATRFEIQDSDPAAIARDKLESGVAALLGGSDGKAAGDPQPMAHFIGQLLGHDFSHSPHLRSLLNDAQQLRHRAFHYAGQFFSAASQGPVAAPGTSPVQAALFVAEDIHWSDESSLDLIAYLAESCRGAPLMIVCLARPTLLENRPAWGEGLPAHTRLALQSLPSRDSRILVERILRKARQVPPQLLERVVGAAEGNPFYIEEIIKMFIERRVIVPGPEHWTVESDRLAVATLPPTLTGVLQARLDTLRPIERAVAQRASVIGRVFWDTAVEHLNPSKDTAPDENVPEQQELSKSQIADALAGLHRKQIIFRQDTSAFEGAVEYAFNHELLRNVAYENVLRKLRRLLHAQVASWLIRQGGERIMETAGLVALHLEKAGRALEAADWYGRAGQQARASYAPAIAAESYHKALELSAACGNPSGDLQAKRLDWHEGLSECLAAQARFAEAIETCFRMRDLAETARDLTAQVRAWNGLAFLHERQGNNCASVGAADRAIALSQQAGESARSEQIKALHFKGWAYYRLADARAVLELADQSLALCTSLGDRAGMARSFKLHGVAHLQLGHYAEADRYFRQGLAIFEECGDRRNEGAMWSNLGESARIRGDDRAAAELYQKALAIVRQIGNRDSELIYLSNLSGARLGLGEFAQAESDLRQVIALTPTGQSCTLSETWCFLSEACLEQGKIPDALQAARQALELAQASQNHLHLAAAWGALGRAQAMRHAGNAEPQTSIANDDPASDPDACFRESLRVYRQIDAEGEQARTLRAWAEFDLQQGRSEAARRKLEEAHPVFLRLGMASELQKVASLMPAIQ